MKTGIVLEGGAFRTIYSSGVCDALLTAGCIACGVGLALMVWAFVLGGGAR